MPRPVGHFLNQLLTSVRSFRKSLIRELSYFVHHKRIADWRFQDIKTFCDSRIQAASGLSAAITDSISRISLLQKSDQPLIAVVSVLPPSDTGIATYTYQIFSKTDRPIDLYFSDASSFAQYSLTSVSFGYGVDTLNAFIFESIYKGIESRGYTHIVWTFGDSAHFLPIVSQLLCDKLGFSGIKRILHFHDPFLLSLFNQLCVIAHADIVSILKARRPGLDATVDWSRVSAGDFRQLVNLGVTGLKEIFEHVHFDFIIVHSVAAKNIILADWPELAPSQIKVLFLPVFLPVLPVLDRLVPLSTPGSEPSIIIGTFGVPGNHRLTHIIVDAFRLIAKDAPGTKLIIAGYRALSFAKTHNYESIPNLVLVDTPSDDELVRLMQSVDIALQLRCVNTGESSGVIPMLLALNKPVIGSAIGSYLEYEEAIRLVECDVTSATLALVILDELRVAVERKPARDSYVSSHSVNHFHERFNALLG